MGKAEKLFFSENCIYLCRRAGTLCADPFTMKKFRVFYQPKGSAVLVALIPADGVKQALTRFNAAGFDGEVKCIQNVDFDSNLFNFQ